MTISNIHELLSGLEPSLFLMTDQAELTCVKLIAADVSCGEHDVLLGRADDFIRYGLSAVPKNLIVLGSAESAKQLVGTKACNMIVIEKNVDIFSVCNSVSGWISASAHHGSGFLEALSTTAFLHRGRLTLEYLASMARRLLLNPCLVANENGDILASDFPADLPDELSLNQELFLNDLSAYLRSLDFGAYKNKAELVTIDRRRIILGGVANRQSSGLYFVLIEVNGFSEHDLGFSRLFCAWAGSEMKAGKIDLTTTSSMGSKYLDYLLNSQMKDPETIAKWNKTLSFREKSNFFILISDVSDFPLAKGSVSSLISTFENKSRQILATVQDNYLVVLISADEPDEKSVLEKFYLDEYIQYLDIPFGMSTAFYSLSGVFDAFQQACSAMLLGSGLSPGGKLYYYKDYMVMLLLDKCSEHTSIDSFVLPQVTKLFEYDRIHKTQYAYTLYILLLSGNKQITAANTLNIHRTTLQYRLDKIKNLISIDYCELYWASRLFLSYSILIYQKKADPKLYTIF